MLLNSISPKNILSFGDDQPPIELTPLNILVGPNGSGKSNLIECLSLLQSAPRALNALEPDWLWKGHPEESPTARIETVINNPTGPKNLRHWIEFTASDNRLGLSDERIENEQPDPGHPKPYFYFAYQNGWPVTNVKNGRRQLRRDDINTELSILSQRKDPLLYPEITWLGEIFDKISIYRDRPAIGKQPQSLETPDEFLSESYGNLEAILNTLGNLPETKQKILQQLRLHSPAVEDFETTVQEGIAQTFVRESGYAIPVSRLSNGTLRYLRLLAILCHPSPPALICIEEPELGLHPEVMPNLADLLLEASSRTQLIVTTHSDLLTEAFIDTPGSVITFAKAGGKTVTQRLDSAGLEDWLDRYTLGPE